MGLLDDLLSSRTDPAQAANVDVLVSYETRIKNINALEDTIEDLSDDELRLVFVVAVSLVADCVVFRRVGFVVLVLLFTHRQTQSQKVIRRYLFSSQRKCRCLVLEGTAKCMRKPQETA